MVILLLLLRLYLLDAGFDDLLFDNGYVKNMENHPNRYGMVPSGSFTG